MTKPNLVGHLMPLYGNNPADSNTPGFPSGFYKDGSTVFPGIGRFRELGIRPARIYTEKSGKGPGAYGYSPTSFDGWEGQYYLNHPNLRWVNTTLKKASNLSVAG